MKRFARRSLGLGVIIVPLFRSHECTASLNECRHCRFLAIVLLHSGCTIRRISNSVSFLHDIHDRCSKRITSAVIGRRRKIFHSKTARLRRFGSRIGYVAAALRTMPIPHTAIMSGAVIVVHQSIRSRRNRLKHKARANKIMGIPIAASKYQGRSEVGTY